ncbi:hypothetical protein J7E62_27530 [Variovorax paradoxus]|nr:hypothetical protein [Variovorax paradoxus]
MRSFKDRWEELLSTGLFLTCTCIAVLLVRAGHVDSAGLFVALSIFIGWAMNAFLIVPIPRSAHMQAIADTRKALGIREGSDD